MLITLCLALFGAVLAVLIWRLLRVGGNAKVPQEALIREVDEVPMPAAASRLNGQLIHANEGFRIGEGAPTAQIEDLLKLQIPDFAASAVYRLARASAVPGFALMAVDDGSGEARYLCCRRCHDDALIWSLVSAQIAQDSVVGLQAGSGGPDRFPYLRLDGDGVSRTNAAFVETFGQQAAPVVEALGTLHGHSGARVVLTLANRETRSFLAFSTAEDDGGDPGVLLLPQEASASPNSRATKALETLPIGLMQFDLDGRSLWSNRQAEHILGQQIPHGMPIDQIFSALGRPIPALLEEAMAGSANRRGAMVRIEGQHDDGFLQITLSRTDLDGLDGFLAVVNDANELRELEDRFAQSQKMEAVGKLAGGVAHDFNNVLTAIKGHCDFVLMGKEQTNPDYEDLIQIRQNSNRAASMVRHLLAFSRQQTLQPQLLNLRDVISDAHVFLNSVIGERVTLHIDHERELWPVMADQHQLEQVLMNLVVNARDAMEERGTVTIATRNVSQSSEEMIQGVAVPPDEYVEISVTDDGTGIPEDVRGRVFDPFFTTKPQGQGTGLGLSTVYGIVKQSGGFIFAENLPDSGACFRMLLPCTSPATPRVPMERPAEIKRDLTGQASVLLVEDEDSIRSVGSRALKLRGYRVHEAASAEDAMRLLSEDGIKVDVLVSDVVMPGMDGPTFAVKARELRPGLRLIFVSGYAEDNFRNADLGEDFLFLPKPFSINELTSKVKEALEETV
ncbi:MAG: ATP-binding protein [Pseudomonadota bacterium]